MKQFTGTTLLAICGFSLIASSDRALGEIYVAAATGFAADTSNPLDGIGDTAGPKVGSIDMFFNGVDGDPGAVGDRRAVVEVDLTPLVGLPIIQAGFEFEVFTANSAFPVNIYTYEGDGLITADDYGRTGDLLFSGVLDDVTPILDVLADLQARLADGDQWMGFLISMTTEDQTLGIYNVGMGGTEPRLNTKVPEPTTLALFGVLSLLTVVRRRPA